MPDTPYPLWSSTAQPQLLASRSHDDDRLLFPALPAASPLAPAHANVPLAAEGTVYSFTVIHPGAKTGLAPYALGYVDLPGPVRIFGRLQGKARPAIGDAYRAIPDTTYGYVFEAVQGDRA
ncbi:Zn-ribbon domain-containing OB-fold protein [Pseudorhodoferax sp.]|uniref:Zn-ribbon domain-containing OB-fold protein n=1 Tax=Pseudorhodoferax sp. TaxID=1993553 RepID=UPI002DD66528|nr:OB-fold domain-containing protein [Pseudorhodoferax sp.]